MDKKDPHKTSSKLNQEVWSSNFLPSSFNLFYIFLAAFHGQT